MASVSRRERAAWSLRRAIEVAAREGFGGEAEPIAGVRAAVLARGVAAAQLRDYAQQARADGHSWDDLAEAMGLEQAGGPATRGERAYLHLFEDGPLHPDAPGRSWGRAPARWRCGSCGQHVTDRGPFEAAPYNNETGHAPDCGRHAADVAAYRSEWDGD